MTIDGPIWFAVAILLIVVDALSWIPRAREQRGWLLQWREYDRNSQRRHDEFMDSMRRTRRDAQKRLSN